MWIKSLHYNLQTHKSGQKWYNKTTAVVFGSGFVTLVVRDNDCSGILFVRKDLAESVPGRPKE